MNAVLPTPRFEVWVGVCRSVYVPSPIFPCSKFWPQQLTEPLSRMAHVLKPAAEIEVAVLPVPKLDVWVGVSLWVVVPSPSPP